MLQSIKQTQQRNALITVQSKIGNMNSNVRKADMKKAEFIKYVVIELVKYELSDIEQEELIKMVNDIRKYLIDINNFETNQQSVGFKALFQGYVIKAQTDTNFNTTKYTELNKILVKRYTSYYMDYQRQRNEVLHNQDYQKKRLRQQYEEEKQSGINREYEQVRRFIFKRDIKLENSLNQIIKMD